MLAIAPARRPQARRALRRARAAVSLALLLATSACGGASGGGGTPNVLAVSFQGFASTRIHSARGGLVANPTLTVQSTTPGSFTFFDGRGDSDAADAMVSRAFPGSATPTDVLFALNADGERQTLAPRVFRLALQVTNAGGALPGDTDGDGLFSDDAAAIVDLTRTEPSEEALVLYTSVPWTEAATPGTSLAPPTINLRTEVGEVAGVGTGPGQVAHTGIGDSSTGNPNLDMVTGSQSLRAGVDLNHDGFGDFAVLGPSTIDVFFGRPGMNTDYRKAGSGGDWPAQPPESPTRGERITLPGADLVALALGDVNGDGNADIVALDQGASAVRVLLGEGNAAPTPFANAAATGRFRVYPCAVATDLQFGRVEIGDVADSAIPDIVIGAPVYDPDGSAATGQANDGAILVLHGSAALPTTGTPLASVAAPPTGAALFGELGNVPEQRGAVIHVGDYDTVPPLDVVAAHGNLAADSIEVFSGAAVFPAGPTLTYSTTGASEMFGGALCFADVAGDPAPDILVGAPVAASGNGRFTIVAHGTDSGTTLGSATTGDYVGAAGQKLGASIAALDYDGNGTLDVVIGASGPFGGFWDVLLGPISGDIGILDVAVRLSGPGALSGADVEVGDVNGDGTTDLLLIAPGEPLAFSLFGLR